MIQISQLTKIYRSKKRTKNKALDAISLTLPDAGFVFVLGKSGSGKSTLLNLVSGLDKATAGKILVDGNDISRFNERRLCDYRNDYIGFIFQDYHLIDELTVYENVRLSLRLLDDDSHRAILEAIEKVGLAGYETRFPAELSGGERQRVAIARAIVKKPRIILADEPTGNLDQKTATQIIAILKEISKDCLVLTVSHNTSDAYVYADRIIELAKGKILADHSRNPQFADTLTVEGETLVYPQNTCLEDADATFINRHLELGMLRKMEIRRDKFIPTNGVEGADAGKKIRRTRLTVKNASGLAFTFLKNKAVAISLSSFMVAVIMVILALAQTIIGFDAGKVIAQEVVDSQEKSMLFVKQEENQSENLLDVTYRVPVGEGDIDAIYGAGYQGKIYPVYNISLHAYDNSNFSGVNVPYLRKNRYLGESLGTLVVDEAFLTEKFGEVRYAAKAEKFHPAGVIITDFLADSILGLNTNHTDKTYEDFIGRYTMATWTYDNLYINGILDTGYKETHAEALRKVEEGLFRNTAELYEDEDFTKFSNDIYGFLGYSYSLNPDFITAYENCVLYRDQVSRQELVINDTLTLKADDGNRYFFSRGELRTDRVGAWPYSEAVPPVPENAKYIRVSTIYNPYLQTMKDYKKLPVADKKAAYVVFSNGESLEASVLKAKGKSRIVIDTGEVERCSESYSYVSDYIAIPEGATISEFCTLALPGYAYCAFYDEDKQFIDTYSYKDRQSMEDSTIVMNYQQYNSLFGTEYKKDELEDFEPRNIQLTQYRFSDPEHKEPLFSVKVKVTGLTESSWCVSDDLAELFRANQVYVNALYLDGIEGFAGVPDVAQELNYEHQSVLMEGVRTMTKAVDVFVPIFRLVAIVLCVGVVFILMNFSTKLVKDKMHEIGILKALGTKNDAVAGIFGLQVVLIAVLTCLLSTFGYLVFIDLANDILTESLKQLVPGHVVLDLDFLTFQPVVAAINCAFVAGLSLLALLIPIFKVRKIEPVKIIRTRE